MTDYSFFESHSDDAGEHSNGYQGRFACSRRFVDLSHTDEQDDAESQSSAESSLAHPEIIELIESLLTANPTLQPAREVNPCDRPHAVYIPEHYEVGYAYPLIVWFHGNDSSEAELAQVMPVISERNYIGVALRGDVASDKGHGWSSEGVESGALLDDVRQIVMSLRREYHIHSERIYLAGFGSGATTAVQVMLKKPEWFGGVISFSGEVPTTQAPTGPAEELKDKRILLATSLGANTTRVGDVVAAGRLLYSVGMKVGTRIYQDAANAPSSKMLRDLDSWLMDDICSSVHV